MPAHTESDRGAPWHTQNQPIGLPSTFTPIPNASLGIEAGASSRSSFLMTQPQPPGKHSKAQWPQQPQQRAASLGGPCAGPHPTNVPINLVSQRYHTPMALRSQVFTCGSLGGLGAGFWDHLDRQESLGRPGLLAAHMEGQHVSPGASAHVPRHFRPAVWQKSLLRPRHITVGFPKGSPVMVPELDHHQH